MLYAENVFSIYKYEECFLNVEGQIISGKCSYKEFPNHTQLARRQQCGELLLKHATLSDGTTKLYPFKSYCYLLQQSLQNLVRRPGFEDKCEIWRSRIHD